MTKKPLIRMLMIILAIILGFILIVILYMQLPQFGRTPRGARLERIEAASNYSNGAFHNKEVTTMMVEEASTWQMFREKMTAKRLRPQQALPTVMTDLKLLPADSNLLVWFGHSSYYFQIEGLRFLVDPVFSGSASPVPGFIKAFEGTDIYKPEQMPEIDYLIISHDHYDHLDYKTVKELRDKVKHVICPLGVGDNFERWGYDKAQIVECDWEQQIDISPNLTLTATPQRHFSGRSFKRNYSLWNSYVLQTPSKRLFLGGDGGYGKHFKAIGEKYGPFDLVILENGQFNVLWQNIHEMPEQVLKAAVDLQARQLLPVHNSKFSLANHPWDEPMKRLKTAHEGSEIRLSTPKIGQVVSLNDSTQQFDAWWEGIE